MGDPVTALVDSHNFDREREQVTRRTTYTKTQRRSRTQEKGVMSRKTLMRILTNSQAQGEAMLKRTRTRTLTSKPPQVVVVVVAVVVVVVVLVGASLPSPSTTTRRRLTMRLASTPTTSYPILRW